MPEANKELTVDEVTYDVVPDEARIAITYLMKIRDKIGITDDVELEGTITSAKTSNLTVRRFAIEIYKIWASLFPEERKEFIESTKFDLDYERPVKEAMESGGYVPVAFPMRLSSMFQVLLPSIKIQDKRFWLPLLSQIPELRKTNYIK